LNKLFQAFVYIPLLKIKNNILLSRGSSMVERSAVVLCFLALHKRRRSSYRNREVASSNQPFKKGCFQKGKSGPRDVTSISIEVGNPK